MSSIPTPRKTKQTTLTPLVYPSSSSSRPENIVVSPYTGAEVNRNNRVSDAWTPRQHFWWKVMMAGAVTGLLICIGIIVTELDWHRQFAAFLFGGDPDDYFHNRIADDISDPNYYRRKKQHQSEDEEHYHHRNGHGGGGRYHKGLLSSWFEAPTKDVIDMNAHERAQLVKDQKNRLHYIREKLYESKIQLANVLEEKVWQDSTIFASVAAYRDVECLITVSDLFLSAKNPRRVFLGIIEQNEHGDPICISDRMFKGCIGEETKTPQRLFFCPIDNIRRRRVAAIKGRGPTYGRYVSMLMYRGESYYMMIDSHNRFRPNWDAEAIKMLFVADSPKPVLSHYPLAWKKDTNFKKLDPWVTVMCRCHQTAFGYVRMGGLNFPRSRQPRRQPFTAAGFLFADAAMIHEVPFDPYLDYLFDGEELLYTVRLWTHGWDAFAPSWNLVYHDYDRHRAPRFWHTPQNEWGVHQGKSVKRVQWLLKIPVKDHADKMMVTDEEAANTTRVTKEVEKYGLGKERSLESFWKYSRVDLVKKTDNGGICFHYGRKG